MRNEYRHKANGFVGHYIKTLISCCKSNNFQCNIYKQITKHPWNSDFDLKSKFLLECWTIRCIKNRLQCNTFMKFMQKFEPKNANSWLRGPPNFGTFSRPNFGDTAAWNSDLIFSVNFCIHMQIKSTKSYERTERWICQITLSKFQKKYDGNCKNLHEFWSSP